MLIAFKNTTVTKPVILKQLRAHAKADEIVKGLYWENGKGCAVGCTVRSSQLCVLLMFAHSEEWNGSSQSRA